MRRVLLGLCAVAAVAAGGASAAFVATTSTPSNSFSAAASFCVSPGTQTVNSDADTYVSQQNGTQNDGSLIGFGVDPRTTRALRSYVHFALPALPHNCSVSATLRLNNALLAAGRTIEAYVASGTWGELTLTWNNQPGYTGGAATAASASGWMTWDVSGQVQTLYAGTNTGFVLRDAAEGTTGTSYQNGFFSREWSSNRPELVVTFS